MDTCRFPFGKIQGRVHLGFKSESALKVLVRCHAISQFFSFFCYAFMNESCFKHIHHDTFMIYREFGKTGFKCSVIGMGTYYDPLWILGAKFFGLKKGIGVWAEAPQF